MVSAGAATYFNLPPESFPVLTENLCKYVKRFLLKFFAVFVDGFFLLLLHVIHLDK